MLLPGDPQRALAVAQLLLDRPKMFNHARGLWGYTGVASDGEPLTVQSTGMGGPSAAIVCEELVALGARRLVRIGTCAGLSPDLELGALLAEQRVLPRDGASAALGADGAVAPDGLLTGRLVEAGARPATVLSSDLFYDARRWEGEVGDAGGWEGETRTASGPFAAGIESAAPGPLAVDLESAAVLVVAERREVRAACVLAVTSLASGLESLRAQPEALEPVGARLGEAGYAALRTR